VQFGFGASRDLPAADEIKMKRDIPNSPRGYRRENVAH
jgi:hypothetical protein